MTGSDTPIPPIVSRDEWERARAELLVRPQELTPARAAAVRLLPTTGKS